MTLETFTSFLRNGDANEQRQRKHSDETDLYVYGSPDA